MEYLMMVLSQYAALIAQGIAVTLAAWCAASCVSLLVGSFLGIMSCRQIGSVSMMRAIRVYTFIAKGVPAYVQILIAYFILPSLLGISVPGFVAATGALALCSSGYVTEIVRAGINAVPV